MGKQQQLPKKTRVLEREGERGGENGAEKAKETVVSPLGSGAHRIRVEEP